jgi:hypothetical protein
MRNIEFKYNVGDYIRFKGHYDSDASCGLFELAGTIAVVVDRADFNGPTYKLSCDEDGWYKEGCFEGLASGSEFLAQQALASGVDTLQGPETNRDTGDSGEFEVLPLEEAKWYRISFSAKLTPDDLRAMKKCFFDAMNESMEIYDLAGLEIKEA